MPKREFGGQAEPAREEHHRQDVDGEQGEVTEVEEGEPFGRGRRDEAIQEERRLEMQDALVDVRELGVEARRVHDRQELAQLEVRDLNRAVHGEPIEEGSDDPPLSRPPRTSAKTARQKASIEVTWPRHRSCAGDVGENPTVAVSTIR